MKQGDRIALNGSTRGPYLKLSDNKNWFSTISEKVQISVLIQKDFKTNCWVISDSPSAKFIKTRAEFFGWVSESEDKSEWFTELALNQTSSGQNMTRIRLWLSTEFGLPLVPGNANHAIFLLMFGFGSYVSHGFTLWLSVAEHSYKIKYN